MADNGAEEEEAEDEVAVDNEVPEDEEEDEVVALDEETERAKGRAVGANFWGKNDALEADSARAWEDLIESVRESIDSPSDAVDVLNRIKDGQVQGP